MTERMAMAAERFAGGLNCAQAVLSVFCEDYGLDAATACRLACGLGGGCRSGEICGALSGAVVVVGLRYGNEAGEDAEGKARCYDETRRYMERVRQDGQPLRCADILGYDVSTAEGTRLAREKGLLKTRCPAMVKKAVQLLEELGY